jgi:RNA polymerase sigma factor (sigma-70 family)
MDLSEAFAKTLHQRLLARDPIAPAELVIAYLEPLVRWLLQRFHSVPDEHLIYDAATDTLLDYSTHPSRFDPGKSPLLSYLRMSAQGDLRNALQKERRRQQRLQQYLRAEPVELLSRDGNRGQKDDDTPVASDDLRQRIFEVITEARDRQLLHLILEGERQTRHYAAILGIQNLNQTEQRRIVKRHKDRLKKQLERLGAKLHEPTSPS